MMNKLEKYDMALGTLLALKRKELGITQQEVCEHFGISRSLICMYEKGKRSMNASLVFAMCDYYKIEADDLADQVRKMADEV